MTAYNAFPGNIFLVELGSDKGLKRAVVYNDKTVANRTEPCEIMTELVFDTSFDRDIMVC